MKQKASHQAGMWGMFLLDAVGAGKVRESSSYRRKKKVQLHAVMVPVQWEGEHVALGSWLHFYLAARFCTLCRACCSSPWQSSAGVKWWGSSPRQDPSSSVHGIFLALCWSITSVSLPQHSPRSLLFIPQASQQCFSPCHSNFSYSTNSLEQP